ncbi:hypothetical protein BLNAU_18124 [Blattamonas nauphoetae]|uniref:Uncharacterized protein n=1 Tax=Blattamonas nauphoetae TaxID=2049346 RepID=A0ABQ9X5B9_9EUKA|nr:hypothetical protein BLNAU_18124 [Blattamonas nauphoetae]
MSSKHTFLKEILTQISSNSSSPEFLIDRYLLSWDLLSNRQSATEIATSLLLAACGISVQNIDLFLPGADPKKNKGLRQPPSAAKLQAVINTIFYVFLYYDVNVRDPVFQKAFEIWKSYGPFQNVPGGSYGSSVKLLNQTITAQPDRNMKLLTSFCFQFTQYATVHDNSSPITYHPHTDYCIPHMSSLLAVFVAECASFRSVEGASFPRLNPAAAKGTDDGIPHRAVSPHSGLSLKFTDSFQSAKNKIKSFLHNQSDKRGANLFSRQDNLFQDVPPFFDVAFRPSVYNSWFYSNEPQNTTLAERFSISPFPSPNALQSDSSTQQSLQQPPLIVLPKKTRHTSEKISFVTELFQHFADLLLMPDISERIIPTCLLIQNFLKFCPCNDPSTLLNPLQESLNQYVLQPVPVSSVLRTTLDMLKSETSLTGSVMIQNTLKRLQDFQTFSQIPLIIAPSVLANPKASSLLAHLHFPPVPFDVAMSSFIADILLNYVPIAHSASQGLSTFTSEYLTPVAAAAMCLPVSMLEPTAVQLIDLLIKTFDQPTTSEEETEPNDQLESNPVEKLKALCVSILSEGTKACVEKTVTPRKFHPPSRLRQSYVPFLIDSDEYMLFLDILTKLLMDRLDWIQEHPTHQQKEVKIGIMGGDLELHRLVNAINQIYEENASLLIETTVRVFFIPSVSDPLSEFHLNKNQPLHPELSKDNCGYEGIQQSTGLPFSPFVQNYKNTPPVTFNKSNRAIVSIPINPAVGQFPLQSRNSFITPGSKDQQAPLIQNIVLSPFYNLQSYRGSRFGTYLASTDGWYNLLVSLPFSTRSPIALPSLRVTPPDMNNIPADSLCSLNDFFRLKPSGESTNQLTDSGILQSKWSASTKSITSQHSEKSENAGETLVWDTSFLSTELSNEEQAELNLDGTEALFRSNTPFPLMTSVPRFFSTVRVDGAPITPLSFHSHTPVETVDRMLQLYFNVAEETRSLSLWVAEFWNTEDKEDETDLSSIGSIPTNKQLIAAEQDKLSERLGRSVSMSMAGLSKKNPHVGLSQLSHVQPSTPTSKKQTTPHINRVLLTGSAGNSPVLELAKMNDETRSVERLKGGGRSDSETDDSSSSDEDQVATPKFSPNSASPSPQPPTPSPTPQESLTHHSEASLHEERTDSADLDATPSLKASPTQQLDETDDGTTTKRLDLPPILPLAETTPLPDSPLDTAPSEPSPTPQPEEISDETPIVVVTPSPVPPTDEGDEAEHELVEQIVTESETNRNECLDSTNTPTMPSPSSPRQNDNSRESDDQPVDEDETFQVPPTLFASGVKSDLLASPNRATLSAQDSEDVTRMFGQMPYSFDAATSDPFAKTDQSMLSLASSAPTGQTPNNFRQTRLPTISFNQFQRPRKDTITESSNNSSPAPTSPAQFDSLGSGVEKPTLTQSEQTNSPAVSSVKQQQGVVTYHRCILYSQMLAGFHLFAPSINPQTKKPNRFVPPVLKLTFVEVKADGSLALRPRTEIVKAYSLSCTSVPSVTDLGTAGDPTSERLEVAVAENEDQLGMVSGKDGRKGPKEFSVAEIEICVARYEDMRSFRKKREEQKKVRLAEEQKILERLKSDEKKKQKEKDKSAEKEKERERELQRFKQEELRLLRKEEKDRQTVYPSSFVFTLDGQLYGPCQRLRLCLFQPPDYRVDNKLNIATFFPR